MSGSQEMRFVIFQEEAVYMAVCLEHYIAAQAGTIEKLQRRLQTVYRAELNESLARTGARFGEIPPAPEKYHQMWEENGPSVTRGTIVDRDEMRLAA